jgi:hypothetical protein
LDLLHGIWIVIGWSRLTKFRLFWLELWFNRLRRSTPSFLWSRFVQRSSGSKDMDE